MAGERTAAYLLRESHDLRERMIETQVAGRGVRDKNVLDALRRVPRELFVPADRVGQAYEDCALPIGPGQTISQPYIVAYMTAQLDAMGAASVLDIGTGTGYQTAVLAHLARCVYTVECDEALSASAAERIHRLGLDNVSFHVGDGSVGWQENAPYDRVLVTAGCPEAPAPLVEQLAVGGVLVAPVGDAETQTLIRICKRESGTVESPLIGCRFVKLVGRCGWPD